MPTPTHGTDGGSDRGTGALLARRSNAVSHKNMADTHRSSPTENMQWCGKCGGEFPRTAEFFLPNKECRNGLTKTCRVCWRAYHRLWRLAHPEAIRRRVLEDRKRCADRTARRARIIAYLKPFRERARRLRSGIWERARKENLPFDDEVITTGFFTAWLSVAPCCPCCGVRFDIETERDGKPRNDSPSVDRINPKKGYVIGNIALICWRCNNLKRDATAEELECVARWMRSVSSGYEVDDTANRSKLIEVLRIADGSQEPDSRLYERIAKASLWRAGGRSYRRKDID